LFTTDGPVLLTVRFHVGRAVGVVVIDGVCVGVELGPDGVEVTVGVAVGVTVGVDVPTVTVRVRVSLGGR